MNRIEKLQKDLPAEALIVDDPVDLFYLTGMSMTAGRMAVLQDRASLFVDGRYIDRAKKEAPCEARLKEDLADFLRSAKKVAFDSAFVTWDGFRGMEKALPGKEWIPVSRPLKWLRAIKDKKEIDALRRAARLTWEGYRHLLKLLKEGVAEEELALEFEFFCRKNGASKLSFPPIVAFGENSAFPHYRAGKSRLKSGQIALFDLGAVVDGYAGDMTRVAFFGRADPRLEKDYQIIQDAQRQVVRSVRPGATCGELAQIAHAALKKEGVAHLFTHGLGHGVGLDVHEFPSIRVDGGDPEAILKPGMVFTVEPGLYRAGLGGVRYEDTVLVTETGVENFFAEPD
jgi:Xaa-Pro aminopeptidase